MSIEITADKRGLIIKTPYSPTFVSELKRLIPASDRQFDGQSKTWIVSPAYGQTIQKIIMTVYREAVHIPAIKQASGKLEREVIRVEYIGQCKQRPDRTVSAYGHDGQSWTYIIAESVLKSFFGQDVKISVEGEETRSQGKRGPSTLYSALLLKQDCTPAEIKSAWRRMARLVHPDVNHEPDAHEQMQAVQRAYEVLSDPIKRRRYDAGLALEESYNKGKRSVKAYYDSFFKFFRAPLRCGLLTVDGEQKLGRVVVGRIYDWRDITDEQGRTLVTSWPFGAETFERRWV